MDTDHTKAIFDVWYDSISDVEIRKQLKIILKNPYKETPHPNGGNNVIHK